MQKQRENLHTANQSVFEANQRSNPLIYYVEYSNVGKEASNISFRLTWQLLHSANGLLGEIIASDGVVVTWLSRFTTLPE